MSQLRILVAVGEADSDKIDTIAETVATIVGERESTVQIGHVLTEGEYDNAVETIAERTENSGQAEPTGRPETGSPHAGASGESSAGSAFEREQSQLPPAEAANRIINQKTLVRDLVTALDDRDIESEVNGAIGDPAESVIEMVENFDPTFVVVGGRDRSPTRQAMFGSVSQQIMRAASCPVVSVRSTSVE